MTDLEHDLRAMLREAGRSAPVVDDLAIRATRPVRRRRTWLASALAVTAIGTVGAIATITVADRNDGDSATTSSPSANRLTAALVARWRPVDIPGFDQARLGGSLATVAFAADGHWDGSDGCNGIGGTYSVDDNGKIRAEVASAMTDVGCDNVPNRAVLARASRFTIVGTTLTFYAADGQRLGTYDRA